jgi:6-phosphogluconate dehydrogenase (decarboxylating)
MMAAFAEGLAIFEAADEMTPAYDLDIPAITEVWRRGSVVASWLLDLTAQALVESEELSEYSTQVSDSGEGRWTVQAAIEAGIPAHVLSASLDLRHVIMMNSLTESLAQCVTSSVAITRNRRQINEGRCFSSIWRDRRSCKEEVIPSSL